jgi:NAD(P)H-dependent FMN reductase
MAPRLNIIVGSTRPGRVGPSIARWFEGFAREHGGFEPVLVDLDEFRLPVYEIREGTYGRLEFQRRRR